MVVKRALAVLASIAVWFAAMVLLSLRLDGWASNALTRLAGWLVVTGFAVVIARWLISGRFSPRASTALQLLTCFLGGAFFRTAAWGLLGVGTASSSLPLAIIGVYFKPALVGVSEQMAAVVLPLLLVLGWDWASRRRESGDHAVAVAEGEARGA